MQLKIVYMLNTVYIYIYIYALGGSCNALDLDIIVAMKHEKESQELKQAKYDDCQMTVEISSSPPPPPEGPKQMCFS